MFSSNDEKMSVGHVYVSWASSESLHSSTWRELEAVNRVLKSNISCLKNDTIRVISDNKNVSKILHTVSKKPYLQSVSSDIQECCSNSWAMKAKG